MVNMPSNKILPDNSLDNLSVEEITDVEIREPDTSNTSDDGMNEVGTSCIINNPPIIIDSINKACSSNDSISSNSYSSSEANAIYLVLGGSTDLKRYDTEKGLFKLGKASFDTIESLKNTQSKFQVQVLQKVSVLKEQFESWERSFFSNNSLCTPTVNDVENDSCIADIFKKIRLGNQLLRSWGISF